MFSSEVLGNRQYSSILELILRKGVRVKSQQGPDSLRYITPPPMRFRLAEGFPVITERDISGFWRSAIGEVCAFINGARTQEELEKYGVKWWKHWTTPEKCNKRGLKPGDLGPGSYGAAWHDFPTADGETFNQWENIIQQIKEAPHLRTHFVSPWVPQHTVRVSGRTQKVVVAPCHGWVHILIDELTQNLTLHMFQRSADFPVGVPSNMVQYAALTMMIAHVTGYKPYEFVHSFSDAHIYVNQIEHVEEMIYNREPRPLPSISMVPKDNLFAFRSSDFSISNYYPHPAIKEIPVAI